MVEGKECYALFNGSWILGRILKHKVKNATCIINTERYGKIAVSSYRVRIKDKEE